MDVACATYEVDFIEERSIRYGREPVWLLGCCYNPLEEFDKLIADINSKFWFTYRKNYPPIGGIGPTSDKGWGCMLRCGQMILGQALVMRHLGRDWRWFKNKEQLANYWKILKLFLDSKDSLYSIHQIAQMGVSEGKKISQWFGPNTAAQVLKKLIMFDEWSQMGVYVAMDNIVVIDDIKKICHNHITRTSQGNAANSDAQGSSNEQSNAWKPLLLFIPLRLGLTDLNPIYKDKLNKCFRIKNTLGIIGGKPNSAHYFIGIQGDYLLYLDPHTVQETVKVKPNCPFSDKTYHQKGTNRLHFSYMDPSVALGFYSATEEEFNELCRDFTDVCILNSAQPPLFEVVEQRPPHWPELVLPNSPYDDTSDVGIREERHFDSDNDFEIIDM
ncbi:uncharacterized protein TRIADDRAFT_20340 [Trichoplax adhaerens]|uniref:Cysteine protease n=1 Tax=Trichoplax adhaerens TaxID=10228 RepID=B3RJ68_TRIAD|nr:hypothetical protein TRIADDRAFT_20340 [Trichoplax adhaerens]EDV28478.1 hypothetical protein TRIADDRAFT_20340 [Trichoplax adhaerens]|eukprot:XP_002107680.1 hypothetical protein TRIADDRAFT_20340 [Trichoplax adhaerens]